MGSPRGAGDVEPERSKGLRPGSGPTQAPASSEIIHSFIHSFIVEPPCPPQPCWALSQDSLAVKAPSLSPLPFISPTRR